MVNYNRRAESVKERGEDERMQRIVTQPNDDDALAEGRDNVERTFFCKTFASEIKKKIDSGDSLVCKFLCVVWKVVEWRMFATIPPFDSLTGNGHKNYPQYNMEESGCRIIYWDGIAHAQWLMVSRNGQNILQYFKVIA